MEFTTYDGKPIIVSEKEIAFLYWKKGMSIKRTAKELNICASVLRKAMAKNGIPRRESKKKDLNIPKNKIKYFYLKRKFSIERTAKEFNVAPSTAWRWMRKYRIPTRRIKYQKYPFSGNPREMAYLQGLCFGDVHAHTHYRQMLVEVTTTHPSMIKLFYGAFQKYGRVSKYPKYNKRTGRYEWAVYALLDSSFDFLLSRRIEDIDENYFNYFLAGFFDCEGCLHIYDNHDYIGLTLLLYNSNKKLLDYIAGKIKDKNFSLKIRKIFTKGMKTTNDYYRGTDVWSIGIYTNNEVKRALKYIPFQHKEKLDKAKITLKINPGNKWNDIADFVISLRKKIKDEVKVCVNQAANEWSNRHGG